MEARRFVLELRLNLETVIVLATRSNLCGKYAGPSLFLQTLSFGQAEKIKCLFCCDVADNFFGQPILDWPTRKCIALGSARGLSYLHDHCDPKIIYRDVKAANVLLDEEFEAVVGDFGLAKLLDYKDTHVTTAVRGTVGHIAPEYLSTGKSSEKTDLYGYGIMLLELITGQRAYDFQRLANDDDLMLLDWVGLSSAQSLCFVRNSTNVDFLRELM